MLFSANSLQRARDILLVLGRYAPVSVQNYTKKLLFIRRRVYMNTVATKKGATRAQKQRPGHRGRYAQRWMSPIGAGRGYAQRSANEGKGNHIISPITPVRSQQPNTTTQQRKRSSIHHNIMDVEDSVILPARAGSQRHGPIKTTQTLHYTNGG
jgi:hypothetical protein